MPQLPSFTRLEHRAAWPYCGAGGSPTQGVPKAARGRTEPVLASSHWDSQRLEGDALPSPSYRGGNRGPDELRWPVAQERQAEAICWAARLINMWEADALRMKMQDSEDPGVLGCRGCGGGLFHGLREAYGFQRQGERHKGVNRELMEVQSEQLKRPLSREPFLLPAAGPVPSGSLQPHGSQP